MKSVVAVVGPKDSGPGERQEMLDRARGLLEQAGAESPTRIDVPATGTTGEAEGALRVEVESLVPALQSGSLFGGTTGVLVMDAQNLLAAEADVAADLVRGMAGESVVVFVSAGALPGNLGKAVKEVGETVTVKKVRERDASEWLGHAARERKLRLHGDAAAVLLQRFGSDLAALSSALDQLAAGGGEITAEAVQMRFRNRPDAPMWHYSDAVAAGNEGEALRRLADFLTHGHPLQLLAFVANELRRRALAAAAPDIETYAEWVGAKPDAWPVRKAWRARSDASAEDLRRAVQALARADLTLKTAPEATHRVTMERLTVALCRWLGARRRRAG